MILNNTDWSLKVHVNDVVFSNNNIVLYIYINEKGIVGNPCALLLHTYSLLHYIWSTLLCPVMITP